MSVVFFFAHQDDEFGVFSSIENHLSNKDEIYCIYLTDGGATAEPEVRNKESLSVLTELGVPKENVMFLGEKLNLHDGRLHENIEVLHGWLNKFFETNSNIQSCYIPALEGGHPDHDILHTAAVISLNNFEKIAIALQYPLYNSLNVKSPFFNVLTPIPANGPVSWHSLTFSQRCRYFRYCFRYKSQWKSWIGLAPFVFLHLLWHGKYFLQEVSLDRLGQRPHDGRLYFECRNFLSWRKFAIAVESIIKR